MHADSYIFDLDGTLVDSVEDIRACLNGTLQAQGRRSVSRPEVMQMVGEGARMLVLRGFAATGEALVPEALDDALADFLRRYEAEPGTRTTAFPGVDEVLATLHARGLPMSVCTNKPEGISRVLIERLGWTHFFRDIIGGDTLPVRKPDPAPVHAARAVLGAVEATVYVGDSPTDREAAAAAGLPCVLVRWGYSRVPVDELGAEWVIDCFEELFRLVD